MDNVRIAPTDSDPVNFPCACWLAEDVWDSKTERELLPGKAVKRPESMCFDKYLPVSFHGTALLNREIFAGFAVRVGPRSLYRFNSTVPNVFMLKNGI